MRLRYCDRPPFARDHLHQHDAAHLVYDIAKPRPDGPRALVLTPLELIDKIAALVPPPPPADPAGAQQASASRATARYLCAMLLARIYEVLPLRCPFYSAEMRIIAFITEPSTVRQIRAHLGAATRPPRFAPARGPPLWEAATTAAASNDPAWDHTPAPTPEIEFDPRITW